VGEGQTAILNLGMIRPTEWNVWINLRSMVRSPSAITLIGYPDGGRAQVLPCGKSITERPNDLTPCRPVAVVKPASLGITDRTQGIDMPKAHLHLIRCSDDIEPAANRRDRRFQPIVIDGGRRANVVPVENPWERLFDLFDLSVLMAQASYLTFVAASLVALDSYARAAAERTN
jgi:hypothetical protein